VVWQSANQDGYGSGIFGQRYDAAATPQGSEFQVNSSTLGNQVVASVASDPDGHLTVVWQSVSGPGQSDVRGRRYDPAGVAEGPEFRVNTYTTGTHGRPIVASDAAGNAVVVWRRTPRAGFW
jgi:hypothetical protein